MTLLKNKWILLGLSSFAILGFMVLLLLFNDTFSTMPHNASVDSATTLSQKNKKSVIADDSLSISKQQFISNLKQQYAWVKSYRFEYEVKEQLQDNDFQEGGSMMGPCPDGSESLITMYYKDIIIDIRSIRCKFRVECFLQSGYSHKVYAELRVKEQYI